MGDEFRHTCSGAVQLWRRLRHGRACTWMQPKRICCIQPAGLLALVVHIHNTLPQFLLHKVGQHAWHGRLRVGECKTLSKPVSPVLASAHSKDHIKQCGHLRPCCCQLPAPDAPSMSPSRIAFSKANTLTPQVQPRGAAHSQCEHCI